MQGCSIRRSAGGKPTPYPFGHGGCSATRGLLRDAAGVTPLLAHRPARAHPGRRHGLPEHVTGGRAHPRREEAPVVAVEGELPEDGLAVYGDDGDDLLLALARKIVAGEEDTGSVESVFEQARQVAAEAEALLVDDGWRAPEPVAGTGAAAEPVADDDTPERQRSLFSWAEFIAEETLEPELSARREARTLSLFEWALERERERAMRRSLTIAPMVPDRRSLAPQLGIVVRAPLAGLRQIS